MLARTISGASLAILVAVSYGCSSTTLPSSVGQQNGSFANAHGRADDSAPAARLGIAPLPPTGAVRSGNGGMTKPLGKAGPRTIAVTDFLSAKIVLLDGSFQPKKKAINDFIGPIADAYDQRGNLYVANSNGLNVTEYDPHGTLQYTYAAGLSDPLNVYVDAAQNVYVADFGYPKQSGVVVEYPQDSNAPVATCPTGLGNEGIAVDKVGNVFVAGLNANIGNYGPTTSVIIEYVGGLKGCHPIQLRPKLVWAGGITVDNAGNLVVCDQQSTPPAVDIIPPPYTAIASTIPVTGGFFAYHVALDRANQSIFIAELAQFSAADILVDEYPSGKNVTTLGSAQGLLYPTSAAALPAP